MYLQFFLIKEGRVDLSILINSTMDITTGNNSIKISEEVLTSIVSIAINEVEGAQTIEPSLTDKITKNTFIQINKVENILIVHASIAVKYELNMMEIVAQVQENIRTNLEIMTSYTVKEVNISVDNLFTA